MKYLRVIFIFLVLHQILSQDNSEILVKLQKKLNSVYVPVSYSPYIENLMGTTDLVQDIFDKNDPDVIAKKYPFIPNSVIQVFKGIQFAGQVETFDFYNSIQMDKGTRAIAYVGVARKISKNKFNFAYLQSDQHGTAKLKQQCKRIKTTTRFLWFKVKVSYRTECFPVGYTNYEIDAMEKKLLGHCINEMKRKMSNINIFAEYILTNDMALYSNNGKKMAKLTDNGQIFIGSKEDYLRNRRPDNLLGYYQPKEHGPFTLEVSHEKKNLNTNGPIVKQYDPEGKEVVHMENFTEANDRQNFLILDDEKNEPRKLDEKNSGETDVLSLRILNKWRNKVFEIFAIAGESPYRLTLLDDSVLLLSDYSWMPLWDSGLGYHSYYDALIPAGYKLYSQNNKYFLYLATTGRLGIYEVSGTDEKERWARSARNYSSRKYTKKGPWNLILRKNGNLEVLNRHGYVPWQSETYDNSKERKKLVVTNNGKIQVICAESKRVIFENY